MRIFGITHLPQSIVILYSRNATCLVNVQCCNDRSIKRKWKEFFLKCRNYFEFLIANPITNTITNTIINYKHADLEQSCNRLNLSYSAVGKY